MKKKIKLSEWAELNGYSYRGAWNVYKRGGIKCERTESGRVLVEVDDISGSREDYTVVYARVSSSENRKNLDSQAERVSEFCRARGWVVRDIVKECASGLNDSRPKLQSLLRDDTVTRIVVEHKDRLTRFGFEYIRTLFRGEVVVVNKVLEDEEDLVQDFVSLVTSFCARIYGRRRSRRSTERLIRELREGSDG